MSNRPLHHPSPTLHPLDDYTKKCHYTRRHYACQHQTWERNPRVSHIGGCQHNTLSKSRCGNMASKPKEVTTPEMCNKCRPIGLGVGGRLTPFEYLMHRAEKVEGSRERWRVGRAHSLETRSEREVEEVEAYNTCGGEEDQKSNKVPDGSSECPRKAPTSVAIPDCPCAENGTSTEGTSVLTRIVDVFKPAASFPDGPSTPNTKPASIEKLYDEEELGWESVTDEEKKDNQLWKEKEDWVHVK